MTKISPDVLRDKVTITYNCVGKIFEENSYDDTTEK